MTRRVHPGSQLIYEASERFVDVALRNDDSLFTPGAPIWSASNIEDLYERFVQQPDVSGDSFLVKLERQVQGAPDATIQLVAETIYFHLLIAGDIKAPTKRKLVRAVLSFMEQPVEVPADLDEIFGAGIVNSGIAFKTYRPFQLHLLIEFAREWKRLPGEERERALSDPWAFKTIVTSVPARAAQTQLNALLHLVHWDAFEPIVAQDHKKKIVKSFAHLIDGEIEDVDRALIEIRKSLSADFGGDFNFYLPGIKEQWDASTTPTADPGAWDSFISWAKRWHEWNGYYDEERGYKEELGELLVDARRDLLEGGAAWPDILRRVMSHPRNNLIHFIPKSSFKAALDSDQSAIREALQALWFDSTMTAPHRLDVFFKRLPSNLISKKSERRQLGWFLIAGVDPTAFPIYKPTSFELAYRLTKSAPPPANGTARLVYKRGLEFLDQVIMEAASRGLILKDRLDAQSVVWCITKWPADKRPTDWPEEEWGQFIAYRDQTGPGPIIVKPPVGGSTETLADLADELLLDESFFERALELLKDKRQLIFYGPPGTGKTFVARRIARYLADDPEAATIVQFHPSYSYEDFVEGYRPRDISGTPGFELVPGPIRRLAERARANPGKHFLVIDEINRGNVAKVFGELYFLLEYRDESMELQYSDEAFSLPENLYFVGTMNTADRSIALIDSALRRRFHFLPFFPQRWPIDGLLARWLKRHAPGMAWVARVVDLANEKLDSDASIGPSHFMRPDLSDDKVSLIWEHSVIPYLEELHFGQEDRVRDLSLEKLLAELAARDEPADSSSLGSDDEPDAD
jgi:5-methylcytosine-specific restriction enzyme B